MSGFVSLTPKIPVLARGRVATSKELWNRTDMESHTCRGPSRRDRLLTTSHEPRLGAHVVTPRRGYTHHGIYAGNGRVVQYRGLARGLSTGPVEEVSLAQFTRGHSVWVRSEDSPCFDGDEDSPSSSLPGGRRPLPSVNQQLQSTSASGASAVSTAAIRWTRGSLVPGRCYG